MRTHTGSEQTGRRRRIRVFNSSSSEPRAGEEEFELGDEEEEEEDADGDDDDDGDEDDEPVAPIQGSGLADLPAIKGSEHGSDVMLRDALFEVPTEPRHALPTEPDPDWFAETEWEAPTTPDGNTLDVLEPDERG